MDKKFRTKKIPQFCYIRGTNVSCQPFPSVSNIHQTKSKINILAISGSLRPNSSNNAVITTAATLVAGEIDFIIYGGIGSLPHFDGSEPPTPEVTGFRKLVADADGVLICTPEYAFGVPGSLKNALDWTVATGEFANKPVALITAATGGDKAHSSLLLTLTALSARVVEKGTLLIPFVRSKMNTNNEVTDAGTIEAIKNIMDTFIDDINNQNLN